jgi:hypothetical protein
LNSAASKEAMMQDALTVYFNGEKYAGLLLAGVAVAVVIAAFIMLRAGGAVRAFGSLSSHRPTVRRLEEQLALGLLINASVILAFDLFAERRGAEYVTAIANGQRSG